MMNSYDSYYLTLDLDRNRAVKVLVTPENRTRLSITVHPDLRITAKAPISKTRNEVFEQVKKRTQWIIKQANYFEKFHPIQPEHKYVSGETHYYLGRQYRLKIFRGNRKQVKLKGKFFEVEISADNSQGEDILWGWYRTHAKKIYGDSIAQYMKYFKRFNIKHPEFKIRRMKKRWGSCPNGRTILLNTELIKAPLYCIDYVIVHELCHLIYPQHSKKFYSLLKSIFPDWQERKERLEQVAM